jgi:hypothetical protein
MGPRPEPARPDTQVVVAKAVLGLGVRWALRIAATAPLVMGGSFLTAAWWELRPTFVSLVRTVGAGEQGVATQHELYWRVVPGRDRSARPSSPEAPRAPRLRLEMVLGFEASDGAHGGLRLAGPDRGHWATAQSFLQPLLHLGDAATLSLPVQLRIDPEYRQALGVAPEIVGASARGQSFLEQIEESIDQPLEILAFSWWLSEPKEVPVSYRRKAPDRAVPTTIPAVSPGYRALNHIFGAAVMAFIAFFMLVGALRLLAHDLSPRWYAILTGAIFLTVPLWSPHLDSIVTRLSNADESMIEDALFAIAAEPTPDRLTLMAATADTDLEVIEWDLSQSRDADLLHFLALDRGGRRFESFEAAYAAILDDIAERITTAPTAELAPVFASVTDFRRPGDRLQEALLEGVWQVAKDSGRSEELRELAEQAFASIARHMHYSYYELASAERLARLQPFRRHPDPEVAKRIREQMERLREHGH